MDAMRILNATQKKSMENTDNTHAYTQIDVKLPFA